MAEERTLGLARATQRSSEDESKEELQRRMELARDSISHTVNEIKDTVAQQYQTVKDTLDWREQFKKRPVAWTAGALGVGVIAGYGIAGAFMDDSRGASDYETNYTYVPRRSAASMAAPSAALPPPEAKDEGPGLVERFKETPAYDALSRELSSLGNKVVEELSTTAHVVVLPFLISKLKEFVGLDRLENSAKRTASQSTNPRTDWSEPGGPRPQREPTLGHS